MIYVIPVADLAIVYGRECDDVACTAVAVYEKRAQEVAMQEGIVCGGCGKRVSQP